MSGREGEEKMCEGRGTYDVEASGEAAVVELDGHSVSGRWTTGVAEVDATAWVASARLKIVGTTDLDIVKCLWIAAVYDIEGKLYLNQMHLHVGDRQSVGYARCQRWPC